MPTELKFPKRAIWILGAILLLVLIFGPSELPHYKKILIGYFIGPFSALFAVLLTGQILLKIERNIPLWGTITIKATGGIAFLVLMPFLWGYQVAQENEQFQKQAKTKIEEDFKDVKPPEIKEDIEKRWSAEGMAKYAMLYKEYEEIQQLAREKYNKEFEVSLPTKMSVASVPLFQGDYAKAVMGSSTIHDKYPDNTNVMSLLGLSLLKEAKYEEAEQIFKEALAKDEEKLGPNHPKVAIHLINLGDVLVEKDLKDEAELKYQRALKILNDNINYGPEHRMTKLVRKRLEGLKE